MVRIYEGRMEDVKRLLDEHPESIGFQYPLASDMYRLNTNETGSDYTCEHKNEVTVM